MYSLENRLAALGELREAERYKVGAFKDPLEVSCCLAAVDKEGLRIGRHLLKERGNRRTCSFLVS